MPDEIPDAQARELGPVARQPGAAIEAVVALGERVDPLRRKGVAGWPLPRILLRVVLVHAPEVAPPFLEDRELEHTAGPLVAEGRVGGVSWVGLARPERKDEQVGSDEREQSRAHGKPASASKRATTAATATAASAASARFASGRKRPGTRG